MKSNEKVQMKNSIEESKPQEWTCMKCGKKGEGYPYARVVGIDKGKEGDKGVLCKECVEEDFKSWIMRAPGDPRNWTRRHI